MLSARRYSVWLMASGMSNRSQSQPARPMWSGWKWVAMSRVSLRPLSGPSSSASQAAREGGSSMPVSISARPGAVLDQVEVDVVEPERQREPRPEDARPNLDDLAGLRRTRDRESRASAAGRGSASGLLSAQRERLKARRLGRIEPSAGVRRDRGRARRCADGPPPRRGSAPARNTRPCPRAAPATRRSAGS